MLARGRDVEAVRSGCGEGSVAAPDGDAHPKGPAEGCHLATDPPVAPDAELLVVQLLAEAALPSAAAQTIGLRDEMAPAGEDQRPR